MKRFVLVPFLLGLSCLSVPAQSSAPSLSAPITMTAYEPFFLSGRGEWEREFLIYKHPDVPIVELWDKDTMRVSITVNVPSVTHFSVIDATVSKSGDVVVSVCALVADEKRECHLAVANRDGRLSSMVGTGAYTPTRVCSEDGSTVWTLGRERSPANNDTYEGYPVLRRYRLGDGAVLEATLDRRTFPEWPGPAGSGIGPGFPDINMQCHGSVVGIYEGATDEWIEYDASTKKLTRWRLPERVHPWVEYDESGKELPRPTEATYITGVAMLGSGEVYASFRYHPERNAFNPKVEVGLYRLEKVGDRGRWVPVASTLGHFAAKGDFDRLCGTDGKHLVYSRFKERGWFFSTVE